MRITVTLHKIIFSGVHLVLGLIIGGLTYFHFGWSQAFDREFCPLCAQNNPFIVCGVLGAGIILMSLINLFKSSKILEKILITISLGTLLLWIAFITSSDMILVLALYIVLIAVWHFSKRPLKI